MKENNSDMMLIIFLLGCLCLGVGMANYQLGEISKSMSSLLPALEEKE